MNPELIDNGLRRDVVDTKQQANAFHEKYVERFTHTSSLANISLTTPNIFSQIKILPSTATKRNTKQTEKRNKTLQGIKNTQI